MELLTIQEAADQLRVSTKTVRRMIDRGELAADHIGPRIIRIRKDALPTEQSDVDAHIAALVASAPPLTSEQRDLLASVLGGAR